MLTKNEISCIHKLYECFKDSLQLTRENNNIYSIGMVYYVNFDGAMLFRNDEYYCNIHNPDLIGIANIYGVCGEKNFTLRVDNPNQDVLYIPPEDALQLVEEKCEHASVGYLIAARMNRLLDYIELHTNSKSYHKVRALIYYTDSLKIKPNVILSTMIINVTGLSRSWVMNIIAELKKGGYISLTRGRLVKINKELPIHF